MRGTFKLKERRRINSTRNEIREGGNITETHLKQLDINPEETKGSGIY